MATSFDQHCEALRLSDQADSHTHTIHPSAHLYKRITAAAQVAIQGSSQSVCSIAYSCCGKRFEIIFWKSSGVWQARGTKRTAISFRMFRMRSCSTGNQLMLDLMAALACPLQVANFRSKAWPTVSRHVSVCYVQGVASESYQTQAHDKATLERRLFEDCQLAANPATSPAL